MDKKQKVSIIIPVANERTLIARTLTHLLSLGADEVIAVDGNSTDGTCELIKREFPSVRCFETAYPDRALQMNTGALEAQSDVFVFVHADMRLPDRAIERVQEKIEHGYIGGGFRKKYEPANLPLRIYEFFLNTLYLGLMRCLVGTNAIFVRREVFESLDGFPEVPLLEDMIFSDYIRKKGRIAIIEEPVVVSSRRYAKNGTLRQILKNARILLGYRLLKESPEDLRERYLVGSYER